MASAEDWMRIALDNLDAAHLIGEKHTRSAVSRAYYAAYSAAHAILISLGEAPPSKGNWGHANVGLHLQAVMTRGEKRGDIQRAFRQDLNNARNYRIAADYGAGIAVERGDWHEARRCAGRVVHAARRVMQCR